MLHMHITWHIKKIKNHKTKIYLYHACIPSFSVFYSILCWEECWPAQAGGIVGTGVGVGGIVAAGVGFITVRNQNKRMSFFFWFQRKKPVHGSYHSFRSERLRSSHVRSLVLTPGPSRLGVCTNTVALYRESGLKPSKQYWLCAAVMVISCWPLADAAIAPDEIKWAQARRRLIKDS